MSKLQVNNRSCLWAFEIAQWVMVLVTSFGTHMTEGENQTPRVVLQPPHECHGTQAYTHLHCNTHLCFPSAVTLVGV